MPGRDPGIQCRNSVPQLFGRVHPTTFSPRRRPATLMSSSSSGQCMPSPSPSNSQFSNCAHGASTRREKHAYGTAIRRPSTRETIISSSVKVTSLRQMPRSANHITRTISTCLLRSTSLRYQPCLSLSRHTRACPGYPEATRSGGHDGPRRRISHKRKRGTPFKVAIQHRRACCAPITLSLLQSLRPWIAGTSPAMTAWVSLLFMR